MKKNAIKILMFLMVSNFSILFSFAQVSVPFKIRYQNYIRGDISIIANNIVNREDSKNTSNEPYDLQSENAKHNDEFDMKYIDIDNDNATFSSSSATLNIENQKNKKILYAGLYWSSTYIYNSGKIKKKLEFVAVDSTRETFNTIKIKLPNQTKYIEISGETIYDGLNQKGFQESAPYAVYADITKEVKSVSDPFGTYTIANIKATQGKISGGVSGGWTIFFIYEDKEMPGKFITTFDGFAGVTNKSTDITFNGFETLPQGNVKAKLATAALEGDDNLTGDQFLFRTSNDNKFVALSNNLRQKSNFFNSSITIENELFTNRNPNSKNTLGYDACLISIPNPENTIIGNNTTEATLRIKSSGDRYFMFFAALDIEVIEPIKPIIPIGTSNVVEIPETPKPEEITNKPTDIRYVNIKGFSSNYFIVANVFLNNNNCINFIKFLKEKGIEAKTFLNPENNYHYVYIQKSKNRDEIQKLYNSNINNTYKDDIWILSVNNSSPLFPVIKE